MKFQRDRIYSLIVGPEGESVEINNLQIKFEVVKTSSNKDKKNKAVIRIYNLSEERQRALESDYVNVQFSVGYRDTGLIPLFAGQVVNIDSKRSGDTFTEKENTDTVTKIELDTFFVELNTTQLSKIIPAGKTVRDVILGITKDVPEITRQEMNGKGIERVVEDGYPLAGTPRQMLDELSNTYNIEWQIDGETLFVQDREGTYSDNIEGVYSFGQFSGLIERPYRKADDSKKLKTKKGEPKQRKAKDTVQFKILLNPSVVAGSIIHLDYREFTGYYKVNEVKHSGDFMSDQWYSELICSVKD